MHQMQQATVHQQKIVDLTNQGIRTVIDSQDYMFNWRNLFERIKQDKQVIRKPFQNAYRTQEIVKITFNVYNKFQSIYVLTLRQSIDFNYKDNQGNTAIVYAARTAKISILNEIIKYKERIETKQIKFALDIAIQSEQDNWDIVETLLQITSLDKPQHLIKSLQKGNYKTASKIIEKYGASGQDENGDTALHVASRKGELNIIKQICQREFLFQRKNKQNQTPLDVAANEKIKDLLIMEETLFTKSPNRKKKQEEQQENIQKIGKQEEGEPDILPKMNKIVQKREQETQTYMKERKEIEVQIPETIAIDQSFYNQLICESKNTLPQHKISIDDIVKQLTFEINTFTQELSKYLDEQKPIIDKIVQLVDETVQNVQFKSRAFLYGSCQTGLNLLDSDIDIVIETVESEEIILLFKLAEQFKTTSFIKDVKVIENAKKPVLKMQCSKEFQDKLIDITISRNDHSGRKTANSMIEFQKEFKQFRSLALMLKFYFKSINLLNSYQGGLNSYCILTMILALLQIKRIRDNENEEIGKNFLDFFDLYGQDLDYYNKIINIVPSQSENMQIDEPNIYQQQYFQLQAALLQLVIKDVRNWLYWIFIIKITILLVVHSRLRTLRYTYRISTQQNALSFGYSAILNAKKCEQPCFFSGYNKPVCCILKQMIQQSKNNHLNSLSKSKQPFYFFNNTY
ncbi:unnamed protein product (macronuclear) [Paramecium tetraurelia]|uniref:Poly(A) RNA polymerase mitochondrial-like central palm domain-containing protein n=1 Tax=Paramecium tetraurelia TaxID=5888 RepID=A0C0X1_PARTE|nr:uncharacterized protein GSPATT00033914001 [Paramecium tetraurelia]CAK64438.1 unnamed protein product [Paramecium tetraurelia]|eukprot:XP_001431836.1 hypothetical protein (macronuclear) [Paramecium tetraurelia strain d4-2]